MNDDYRDVEVRVERLERMTKVLQAARSVNRTIVKAADCESLLQTAADSLHEKFPGLYALIVVFDDDRNFLNGFEAGWGETAIEFMDELRQGNLPRCCSTVLSQGGAIRLEPDAICDDCPIVTACADRYTIAARAAYEGRVLGVLYVSLPGELLDEELVIFSELADDICVAYRNAENEKARVEAEQAFRETRSMLFAAMNQSHAGIAIADAPSGKLRYVNDAGLLIRGGDRESVVNGVDVNEYVSAWKLLDLDGTPLATDEAPLARAVKYGEECSREFIIRRDNNEDRVIWANAAPIRDDDGNVSAGIVVFLDITERKQVETALRETSSRLREQMEFAENLINTVNVIIMLLDKDGRIIRFNRYMEELTGYRLEEVKGKEWFSTFIPEEDADSIRELFHKSVKGLHVSGNVNPIVAKDGRLIDIEWHDSDWLNVDGEVIGLLCAGRDITEQKAMEQQIRQMEKMQAVGLLAGGIAHDFNNILSGIFGFADAALAEAPQGARLERQLKHIIKASERARDLVHQILAFSRQSEDEQKILDVRSVLGEIEALLRAAIPSTVKIRVEIPEEPCAVFADPTRVHETLMNLATNGVYAMNDRGVLTFRLKRLTLNAPDQGRLGPIEEGSYIVIEIIDTGSGMDHETMNRMFEPFYTTKEVGKGTGMGLAVVFGSLRSHNANVQVESELGKGTTFRLFFKQVDKAPVGSMEYLEEYQGEDRGRILFVDDEELLVEMFVEILEFLGYEIVASTSSNEGLRLFKADPMGFDLLITDQTMPEITGLELAAEVLKIRPDFPIILCTGYSSGINEEVAAAAGIAQFCFKPLRGAEIIAAVRGLLGRSSDIH